MKVSDVIDDAVSRAFPHLGPEQVAKGSLLRTLASYEESVVQLISRLAPQILAEESAKVSCSYTKNKNGYRLKDAIAYIKFSLLDDDGDEIPIRIVTSKRELTPAQHPAGVVRPGAGSVYDFYPSDPEGKDWEDDDDRIFYDPDDHRLLYKYVPAYERPTSLSDDLQAPDFARPYLTQVLVTQILTTQPSTGQAAMEKEVQRESILWQDLNHQIHRHSPVESTLGEDGDKITIRQLKDRRNN